MEIMFGNWSLSIVKVQILHRTENDELDISRYEPVVQAQARDVLVISRVMGHKRQVMHERDRRDHEVRRRHLDALAKKPATHDTELFSAGRIKCQNCQVLKKIGDQREDRRGLKS